MVERQVLATTDVSFVRTVEAPSRPAPLREAGIVGWLRTNLFSSPGNVLVTLLAVAFIAWVLPPIIRWAFTDAVWSGPNRDVCAVPEAGACWAFVKAKLGQFIYGRYPLDQRWRVDLVFILLVIGLVPMAIPGAPFKRANGIYLLVILPVVAFFLLVGGRVFALFIDVPMVVFGVGGIIAASIALQRFFAGDDHARMRDAAVLSLVIVVLLSVVDDKFDFRSVTLVPVETALWGGLLLTLVVAIVGMVTSLPLGTLLALGRRSELPVVRFLSIVFIEFVRGVPLITVLFMASLMLPMFLPPGANIDKLLRALIGVALFSSAYMAEVVRGGLQAIPKGQYEGAMALGLGYWQRMRMIILPQALKLVIPGIVNSYIALFKDTSLVLIIGLFDLLGIVQLNFADQDWALPQTPATGYVFAAAVYWVFCFGMSRYSLFVERRLNRGHRR